MANPFEVLPYTAANLRRYISEKAGAKEYIISGKRSLGYLEEYFVKIGATTIIIEKEYVDRDYLIDFSAFQVRCFRNYEKHCSRFHFFSIPFTAEDFMSTVGNDSAASLTQKILQETYLGFVTIKPLPESVFGRTCLKPFTDNGGRQFLVSRPYTANLYGISLTIDTVAFQEQDSETSACASISLWSSFQVTAKKFQHTVLSPVEITQEATRRVPLQSRTFGNHKGLSLTQMSDAIRAVKLEPLVINIVDECTLKNQLYSYLRLNIPVVLAMDQFEPSRPDVSLGFHAVAVTGFSLGEAPQYIPSDGFKVLACRINNIFVHDDQIGPYSPMKSVGETKLTLWSKNPNSLHAKVLNILVALPPPICIIFETISDAVKSFDSLVEFIRGNGNVVALSNRLEWDIYLIDVVSFKKELRTATNFSTSDRIKVLTKSMPHFLWRASALDNNSLLLDLLFDATDIHQGDLLVCGIDYDTRAQGIRHMAGMVLQSNIILTAYTRRLYESYATGI